MSALYCLFEEYEKLNGQHKYGLLAASTEKDLLRELMKAKIATDEHGLIAQKGVEYFDEDSFKTHSDYNFGFLKYHITSEFVLTRQELLEAVQAEKQKTTATLEEIIWDYPKTKPTRDLMTECKDGYISLSTILAFITEWHKEAGLTKDDLQTIRRSIDCQSLLLNELKEKINREDKIKNRTRLRDFYSEERREALLCIIKTAYIKYISNNERCS